MIRRVYKTPHVNGLGTGGAGYRHDIILIGASTGGVEALRDLVSRLPGDLPAAVFVVVHLPENAPSALPKILDRAGPMRAVHPEDGEEIRAGRIYVAPPNLHLLVESGRVCLGPGPKENRHRPAVDTLFRSAAEAYGRRVVGVVLTGALNDGTDGLVAVKRRGGVAVVQDPKDAMFPSMPESALEYVEADHVVTLDALPPVLTDLVEESPETTEVVPVPEDMEAEARVARGDPNPPEDIEKFGTPSAFSCPECHGPFVGDPGRGPVPLPLPGGPRLHRRERAGRAVRDDRGGALRRPQRPPGERRDVREARRKRP